MKLIGENIHIISKKTRSAIESRDSAYVLDMAKRQAAAGVDWIDLNIGPAKKGGGTMEWLASTILSRVDANLSFDTTNMAEMEAGIKLHPRADQCLLNSASGDPERLEGITGIAAEYGCNLIALTMAGGSGIPKDPDSRLEIASVILEKTMEMGIDNSKVYLDPLVLPVGVDQSQAMAALDSIRVFKESFDPPVMTTIGLSNVSNGSPGEIRPLLNRVFCVMAMGCGLDSAIVDAFDVELLRVIRVVEAAATSAATSAEATDAKEASAAEKPEKEGDNMLISLHNLMQEFGELEDLPYDSANPEEVAIYKTAEILFNKNIYAHNYAEC